MARSKLIELFTRLIEPQNRTDKIYCNGADNLYPERIERVINNSVTANLSVKKTIQYVIGQGFGDKIDEIVVNTRKNLTFYDILKKVARDTAYHDGHYYHMNYDIDGEVNYLDVLKYKYCRIAEEDDYGSTGHAWFHKDWKDNKFKVDIKKNNKQWYYSYNPDINVINEQRRNDCKINGIKDPSPEELISNYRGQVLFVNRQKDEIYPNSPIDPAYNDADTEFRISEFRNNSIRNGFQGANIFIVPAGSTEEDEVITDEQLVGVMGSENASNILKVEVTPEGDKKLEDYLHVETIKPEINSEQFQYDEKVVKENIMDCYEIPELLVKSSKDSAMFGPNAKSLIQSKEIFQENTEKIRRDVTDPLNMIFKDKYEFEIIPLIEVKALEEVEEEINDDTETNIEE